LNYQQCEEDEIQATPIQDHAPRKRKSRNWQSGEVYTEPEGKRCEFVKSQPVWSSRGNADKEDPRVAN
jgi:hypothetical protein